MKVLAIREAFRSGRAERVPPRKSAFASFPGLPRKAILACIAHPRRGGLRTPASETSLSPGDRPIRPPGVPLPSMIMLCLGLRTASQHGRGDRAPPRKSAFASFPGLPRKAILACIAHPPEGRAPHARNDGITPRTTLPLLPPAHRQPTRGNEIPCHPHGLATRARRPRPSEKTASRVVSGPSSVRPSVLGLPPAEGRAPHAR
jgi:hypothetical protein